jgi:predicted dehydrogenase
MNWWAGSRPERVSAFGSTRFNHIIDKKTEVIDNATVSFAYENHIIGTLMLCMFAPDRQEDCLEMGVIGDKGLLQTQMSQHTITVWPRAGKRHDVETFKIAPEIDGFDGHLGFIEEHHAFLAAIHSGASPLTSVRECVSATLLAIAAEQAIKQGRVIDVEKAS